MSSNSVWKRVTLLTINSLQIFKLSGASATVKNELLLDAIAKSSPSFVNWFSSSGSIPIVVYKEVKELPKHPEKLLVDVREPNELRETGQIPTSVNIPLNKVAQEFHPDLDESIFKAKYGRDKPKFDTVIIFHCKIGKRSQNAAEILQKLGYQNVKNYVGSWTDWATNETKK